MILRHESGKSLFAVIPAAGNSSRLGRNKQLLLCEGEPVIRRAVRIARSSGVTDIVVVTGFEAPEVAQALGGLACTVVHNAAWPAGLGGSLRAGAKAGLEISPLWAGVLILLPDQILVTSSHLSRLVAHAEAAAGATIVATRFQQTLGPPALFKAAHFQELLKLPDDSGAKALFSRHGESLAWVDYEDAAVDVDRVEDLARLKDLSIP